MLAGSRMWHGVGGGSHFEGQESKILLHDSMYVQTFPPASVSRFG